MRRKLTLHALACALALTALAAASAQAKTSTSLCTQLATGTCSASDINGVHWESTSFAITAGAFTVTCGKRLMQWLVLALGSPQVSHTTQSTASSCQMGGSACTVTQEKGPTFDQLRVSHNLATVTELGTPVTFKCGLLECSYSGNQLLLHHWGSGGFGAGELPVLSVEGGQLTRVGGSGLCAQEATVSVVYRALEVHYVTE